VVARRHDINANLLFKWKRQEEAGEPDRPLLEGPAFVPIGVVGRADDGGPALLARMPRGEGGNRQNGPGEPWQPSGPESQAGVIEIALPGGARVRVDALVDGRALTRVLSALKRCR
jgi:transposase